MGIFLKVLVRLLILCLLIDARGLPPGGARA
jgi:hypothetical protein